MWEVELRQIRRKQLDGHDQGLYVTRAGFLLCQATRWPGQIEAWADLASYCEQLALMKLHTVSRTLLA